MQIRKSYCQLLAVLISISIISTSLMPVYGLTTPVIPLSAQKVSFSPTVAGNNSLYVVPATNNPTILRSSGQSTTYMYTQNSGNSLTSSSSTVSNGNTVPISATSPDSLSVANPFFPTESLPVLVNMSRNDTSLYYQNAVQLSLHMGHSSTFYFNSSVSYYALVETNQPFFLDINVINPSSRINFNFTGTQYPNGILELFNKYSIPVIPKDTNLQAIKIYTFNGIDSLVTVTPLPFTSSSFGSTTVAEGQYYSDNIVQGQCYDVQSNPAYEQTLKLMQMKFFQFPITKGQSYQLYFYDTPNHYFNSTYMSCPAGYLAPVGTDFQSQFNYYSGNLFNSNTGLTVNAKANGFINVTLIGTGLLDDNYGFYFRQAVNFTLPVQHALTFNKPINLKTSPNDYYTFNITTSSMLAINYTSTVSAPTFSWSSLNVTDNTHVAFPSFDLWPESGNLVNDSTTDLAQDGSGHYNWIYIPAGSYRLDVSTSQDISTSKYEFNLVPVMTFSGSVNLNMNINSIYAVQLPVNPIDYNYINASTTAHDNYTVRYQWGIIGKYSIPGTTSSPVSFTSNSFYLGNAEKISGIWTANPLNNTNLLVYTKPTWSNFVPILMIRPYTAVKYVNSTYSPMTTSYSTSITISSNTPLPALHGTYDASGSLNTNLIGTGYQYANQALITSSKTININDNITVTNTGSNTYAVFAFILSTTPGQPYNLTVSTYGNYTSGSSTLNATISSVYVHSDNLINTNVFSLALQRTTNTTNFYSQIFFPNSVQSYLFVRVHRHWTSNSVPMANATLTIGLTKIVAKTLNLNSNALNFSYNSTISNLEVVDTTPLWTISSYSYPGSGSPDLLVPLLLIGGGIIVIAAGAGGIYYFRKKGGLGGKFPR